MERIHLDTEPPSQTGTETVAAVPLASESLTLEDIQE